MQPRPSPTFISPLRAWSINVIPPERLLPPAALTTRLQAQHKIQSGGNDPLALRLEHVPKTLGCITRQWAPKAFTVGFKVQNDIKLLPLLSFILEFFFFFAL
jgi:hypothetical protein